MEGLNFTIAKKMMLFAIVIFVTIFITGVLKFNNLLNTEKNFNIFKDRAVAGKFYVLEVEKELNFVARNSRDIMLGNAYENNIIIFINEFYHFLHFPIHICTYKSAETTYTMIHMHHIIA